MSASEKINLLEATRVYSRNSDWFSGHFPDHPILPGIAQLAAVVDLIRQERDAHVTVKELKRIKFKQLIQPEDPLTIQAIPNPEDPETYSFSVYKQENGTVACQGIIKLKSMAMKG